MQYLSHFVHAFIMFVAPLKFLGYKSTTKQKILFTILYGSGIVSFRRIYDFLPLPFGTHTILLIILSAILFKKILQDIDWSKSIYTSLILFIALLINDALILLPFMKMFNLTIQKIESNSLLGLLIMIISNVSLILISVMRYLKRYKNKRALLNN